MPNLIRVPGFGDQLRQASDDFIALRGQQVLMIQSGQAIGHFVVLHDQRTAGHFGGMCCQNVLDTKVSHSPVQFIGTDATVFEAAKHLFEGFHHQVRLMTPLAADAVVLFRQIGQVQELVKGAGYRQQLVITKLAQQVDQALAGTAFLATVGLGSRPHFFYQLVAILPGVTLDTLPQQLAQHANVFSKVRV